MYMTTVKRRLSLVLALAMIVSFLPVSVLAANLTLLDGNLSVSNVVSRSGATTDLGGTASGDITSNTTSDGLTITATANGRARDTTATNTVTISNETGNLINLSFDYSASNYSGLTFGGVAGNAAGHYSTRIESGETLEIKLQAFSQKAGGAAVTATLTLSNMVIESYQDADVTVLYDSALGTVTADGNAVANEAVVAVEAAGSVELAATQTANKGDFIAWVDTADNMILSTNATFTLEPTKDVTVKAVFRDVSTTNGYYAIGGASAYIYKDGMADEGDTGLGGIIGGVVDGVIGSMADVEFNYGEVNVAYLYNDLDAALTRASETVFKYVVLMNDATLEEDVTVPDGVVLLVPFDDKNTVYSTEPIGTTTDTTPTAYRTLTLAENVVLTVNGELNLSAGHRRATAGKASGSPTGKVSWIEMQEGSQISVQDGGVMYAYGYVTGNGTVEALSGAVVAESFQFMDYRGGSQSTSMQNKVFPVSQYYIQNIEVPLTIYAGASEYAITSIYAQDTHVGTTMAFVGGEGSLFQLVDGYFTKTYDGTRDYLCVELHGEVNVASVDLNLSVSSINSASYVLGLNNNLDIRIAEGSSVTLAQDLALLPGAKITIDEGATVTVSATSEAGYYLYVYDVDEWGKYNYAFSTDTELAPLKYAPGRNAGISRTADTLVDASICVNGTLDASNGYFYTTSSGANIYSTGSGVVKIGTNSETATYQYSQTTDKYTTIPVTSAKLMNSNGGYVLTGPYEYTYDTATGMWNSTHTSHTGAEAVSENVTSETCTEDGIYDAVVYCASCGVEMSRTPTVLPATHIMDEGTVTKEPGCTTEGVKTYQCTREGCEYTTTESIGVLDHSDAENDSDHICDRDGCTETVSECTPGTEWSTDATNHWHDCTECGADSSTAAHADSNADHLCDTCSYKVSDCADSNKDHACDLTGCAETIGTCEDTDKDHACDYGCGKTYGDHADADKDHVCDYGCTETIGTCADTDKDHACDYGCGKTYGDHADADKDHVCDYGCNEAIGTCEDTDTDKDHVCDYGCGKEWNTCSDVTTDADHNCDVCGKENVTGHSYESVVTAPTCEADGYTTYTCNCGDTYTADEVDALGHSFTSYVSDNNATCENDGTKTAKCDRCEVTNKVADTGSATGHSMGDWIVDTEATCESAGSKRRDCANCDHTETEKIDALGHDEVSHEAKAPTCTEKGWDAYVTCSRCDYSTYAEKGATGHVDTTTTTVDATCTTDGSVTVTCSCGHVVSTETIGATGHSYTSEVTAPTCGAAGYTTYTCSACGDTYTANETAATGAHTYESVITGATNTEKGYTTHTCTVCGDSYVDNYTIIGHYGFTLLFEDDITIKVYSYVTGETANELPNAGLEIWSAEDYDSENLGEPTKTYAGMQKNGKYYQITTEGIAAKNMGDKLYIRRYIVVDDVKYVSEVREYSPAVYCKNMIEKAKKEGATDKQKAQAQVCIALMNYGAEAQEYFASRKNATYTYDELMNTFMTEEERAWSYDDSMYTETKELPAYAWTPADTDVIARYGESVVTTGALQIKSYITVQSGATVRMLYWTEATAGDELLIENAKEMSDVGPNGSYYQGYITGLAAKNLGDTVYFCAEATIDGETYYTAPRAYSVHKYAANQIAKGADIADMCKTIVIYSNAAKYYFETE